MLERIVIIVIAILGMYFARSYFNKRQLKKVQSVTKAPAEPPQNPTILYFWSPQCQHCTTTQKPTLEKIKAQQASTLQLKMININDKPEEATHWGVRTVPTTYILDISGNIAHINNGLATEKQLLAQLDSLADA